MTIEREGGKVGLHLFGVEIFAAPDAESSHERSGLRKDDAKG
jgi:hypothetical protein